MTSFGILMIPRVKNRSRTYGQEHLNLTPPEGVALAPPSSLPLYPEEASGNRIVDKGCKNFPSSLLQSLPVCRELAAV